MQLMSKVSPFIYTIDGALFEGDFVEGGSFRENLEFVVQVTKECNWEGV